MIRDRDRIYGGIVARRLHAMGIRDKPTAPASPWETGFADRLIGSIRRECMDHIVVFGEAHLQSSDPRADIAAQRDAERVGRGIWKGSYVEPWLYRACIRASGDPTNCSGDANAHP